MLMKYLYMNRLLILEHFSIYISALFNVPIFYISYIDNIILVL